MTIIEDSIDQDQVDQLKSGEKFELKLSIANGSWNSKSTDKNETAVYTAPSGTIILGHEVRRTGHHSSASWVRTDQAGAISLDTGVVANLMEKIREGFLKGALTWKGAKLFEGDGAAKYSEFLKEFTAHYRFYASTNSSITFRWTTNTTWGSNGATINAYAIVGLAKISTEADAAKALEVIRFAIESGVTNEINDLIGITLGSGKTAQEVRITPVRQDDE